MQHDHRHLDQKLLEQTAGLRSLALRLVRDESQADDLVQDTWVAFLRKPPTELRALRSWTSRVLRNLSFRSYHDRERRRRRESAVARPEATVNDPHQLVERAETYRRLVESVIELEEPFRSTVLLSFFEGVEPKSIASQQGVHVNTVRYRLREAMKRLRHRLDQDHNGDRATWCRALLPLIGVELAGGGMATAAEAAGAASATVTILSVGGTVMQKKTIGAVAVAVVGMISVTVGIGFGSITADDGDRMAVTPLTVDATGGTEAGRGVDTAGATVASSLDDMRERARDLLAAIAVEPPPTGTASIHGVVTTREGEPFPGVAVFATYQEEIGYPPADIESPDDAEALLSRTERLARSHRRVSESKETLTDENGEFTLEGIADNAYYSVKAFHDGWKMMDADLQKLGTWPDNWSVHTQYGTIKRDVRAGQPVYFVAEPAVYLELDVRFPDGEQPQAARVFHRRSDWGDWRLLYWYPEAPKLFMAAGNYQMGVRIGEEHSFRSENIRFHISPEDPQPKIAVTVFERTGIFGAVSVSPGEDQDRLYVYLAKVPAGGELTPEQLVRVGTSASASRSAGYQFRFKEIAPGPHMLGVARERGEIWESKVIEIEEGRVASETIDLPALRPNEYVEVKAVGPNGDPIDIAIARFVGNGFQSRAMVRRSTGVVWLVYPRALIDDPARHTGFLLSVTTSAFGERQESVATGVNRHVVRFLTPVNLRVTVHGYGSSEFSNRVRFRVSAMDTGAKVAPLRPRPSADGMQEFAPSQSGQYRFSLDFRSAGVWESVASTHFQLTAGDNMRHFSFPEFASVSAFTAPALAGRRVRLIPRVEADSVWSSPPRWASVDPEGRIEFSAVLAGDYDIVPSWNDRALGVSTFDEEAVELPDVVDVKSASSVEQIGERARLPGMSSTRRGGKR